MRRLRAALRGRARHGRPTSLAGRARCSADTSTGASAGRDLGQDASRADLGAPAASYDAATP
ncbi:hypothetical protein [Nocardioides plantarum]|uniref:hypothetical protein n=1 Tax=Nocardioides plantarum TaxID=29299 RepID=UPI0036074953